MKLGFLVLVPLMFLAGCKGNSGKTAAVDQGGYLHLDQTSQQMTVDEFIQYSPTLDLIQNNGRNSGVRSIQLRFNYRGGYDLRVRSINSMDQASGQIYAPADSRAGLTLVSL